MQFCCWNKIYDIILLTVWTSRIVEGGTTMVYSYPKRPQQDRYLYVEDPRNESSRFCPSIASIPLINHHIKNSASYSVSPQQHNTTEFPSISASKLYGFAMQYNERTIQTSSQKPHLPKRKANIHM